MPFTPEVRAQMENELERLQKYAGDLQERLGLVARRIQGIQQLLSADEDWTQPVPVPTNGEVEPRGPSLAGKGLRESILMLLDDRKSMAKPRIIELLDRRGFRPKGTTALRIQLSNELYRLRKERKIKKMTSGGWRLNSDVSTVVGPEEGG